jgi:hypothetical protein
MHRQVMLRLLHRKFDDKKAQRKCNDATNAGIIALSFIRVGLSDMVLLSARCSHRRHSRHDGDVSLPDQACVFFGFIRHFNTDLVIAAG